MPRDCEKNPEWMFVPKHRTTMADWDNEYPHEASAKPHGRSFYDPYAYGTDELVKELELLVWQDGILIERRKAKYMDRGQTIGVCSGELTNYAFAECVSGFVHGRPISPAALKRMGVNV